jgi:hypothetical protein
LGSPRGLQGTITDGIVSAIRDIEGEGRRLQISAPISPGSSGSPVLNSAGKVLGVVATSITDSQQLNFAVPSTAIGAMRRFSPTPLVEVRRLYGDPPKRRVGNAPAESSDILAFQRRIAATALAILDRQDAAITGPSPYSDVRELANQLMESGVGALRAMEVRYGWPEDKRGDRLASYLYIYLNDNEKQSLVDAASALVCQHMNDPAAWRLLWLTGYLAPIGGSDQSARAVFEIARLEPNNGLARYDFLRTYYSGGAVYCPIRKCDSDPLRNVSGAIPWSERVAATVEAAVRLLDPEACLALLETMEANETRGSWRGIPAYCSQVSRTYERLVFTRCARAMSPDDAGFIVTIDSDAAMLESRLRDDLDPTADAAIVVAAHREELGKALQWRTLSLEMQASRNALAKIRGEPTPPVPSVEYSDKAFLHYLLGDTQSAVQAQVLAAQLSSQLSQWSLDRLLADEQEYSLESFLFRWRETVREQCRLALLEKLQTGEVGGARVVRRIEDSMSASIGRLKDTHRNSPAFQGAEAELRRLVLQTWERLR